MKSMTRAAPLFVPVIVAVTLAVPASMARDNRSTSNMPTGKNFITQAAQINLGEIELGKLAQEKGNNQAIKDFGNRMVEDHTMSETQLQQLAKAENITLPTAPGPAVADLQRKLAGESGAQFDETYLQHMLSGHKQAILTFENEVEHGKDTKFKSYADNTLPVIQDHIRIAEDVAGKMHLSGKAGLDSPSKAITAQATPE